MISKTTALLLLALVISPSCFAERVILKSGESLDVHILERTDKYISVQTGGSPMYLPMEEIERIIDDVPSLEATVIDEPSQEQFGQQGRAPISATRANGEALEAQYQQLFQDALRAFDQQDFALAETKFKAALEINPEGKELLHNLALAEYNQVKFDEAAAHFYKAVDLGFNPEPQTEQAMRPYKYTEFSIDVPGGYSLLFKGSTNCSDQLILDMLPSIVAFAEDAKNIVAIKPKFIQWGDGGRYWSEEWLVETKDGNKEFFLTLTQTPGGGTDYQISPR